MAPALLLAGCITPGMQQPDPAHTPDNPEPGLQGWDLGDAPASVLSVPYSMGVNVVGHHGLNDRGGNLIMAWSRSCAYVASGLAFSPDGNLAPAPLTDYSGVAVIDVSDPAEPQLVRYLQDEASLHAAETLHAAAGVLAASTYGGVPGINGPPEGWLSIYDVSDCDDPVLRSIVKWPEPSHTITVSPDGRFVYGTVLNPFTGEGGVQVMDISDPALPGFVGKFEVTRPDGSSFAFGPHELVFSPDASRLYVGVTSSQGANAEHEFQNQSPGVPSPAHVSRDAGGLFILDNTDIAAGRPDPKLRLIGSVAHAGWHSPARATIGGVPHIVNAGELGPCPGAWPRITDISDETAPEIVGEFRMEVNYAENCPPPEGIEVMTGGMLGRLGSASSHFQDVDDAENTQLGLFPFMSAGVRIADLRDASQPVEIAYFRPGDPCMSHVNFDAGSQTIWFACEKTGFWVVELKPELRRQRGL